MEQPRRLEARDYTVGWISALPIELAAAEEMLDETHEDSAQDNLDPNRYTLGCICDHNVVIACLPAGQTGTTSAAAVALRMKSKFPSIRFGLMVGVGGGVPSADVRLGDVVVSLPHKEHGGVVQYDFGKTTADGFERTGSLNVPPDVLLSALSTLQANYERRLSKLSEYLSPLLKRLPRFSREKAEPDVLFPADYNHVGGDSCERCEKDKEVKRSPRENQDIVVHYGTIASGNQVMRDATERNKVSEKLGGVLCFEMEAAGLMNRFPCLIIRGICDYADSHKSKIWQRYAAAVAAAYAKELLSVIPVSKVAETRTVDEAIISGMLRSTIDGVNLDQFLPMLSVVDQQKHMSAIPPLDSDNPMFYWILRNIDFMQWCSAKGFQVLWLSGPSERNIHEVSSYIVGQEKNTVLYFFFSSRTESTVTACVHTLLSQIVRCSPTDRSLLVIRNFLHGLLDEAFNEEAAPNWKERGFREGDSPDKNIQKLLNAPENEQFTALRLVLGEDPEQCVSIVVDGLDKIEYRRGHFIRNVRAFVEHLQQRTSKVKILLTSRPLDEIKDLLDGLPCIEHDRERKECLASLRFDNTRYQKISREHEDSFKWIWTHDEYRNWSASDASRLLYIQGKPGSGKSTLTKYFNNSLLEQEPAAHSAIVARFFYSFREGELQRSHYNMLRSILYDILNQDETFFYHRFQTGYRVQRRRGLRADWDYPSLKAIFKSLQDHLTPKRLYLIIDAVDESEENDKRDILNLLFELCSKTKHCIAKVFVASRPVGQLDLRISESHNVIRLQDETKLDIAKFAQSFLVGLNVTHVLAQATEYITENAQGVFLWAKLVGEELEIYASKGCSEEEIFEFLKRLPRELKDFYKLMFERLNKDKENLPYAVKMFQFVLFARRPLAVDELLHALSIPDNPNTKFTLSDKSFQKRIPTERRIISCGGNFLEIKPYYGNRTVQVMHQSVREFFLDRDGYVANSKFRMCERDAHACISMTCIRYLMLCAANTTSAGRPPDIKSWGSEHLEGYAQYLDKMPLANYALCHLKHHFDGSRQDVKIRGIIYRFIHNLTRNPAAYLLESWVNSHWNKILLSKERGATEDGSQQDVKVRGIIYRFIHNSTRDLAGYLLESWVSSYRNEILSSNERGAAEDGSQQDVKIRGIIYRFIHNSTRDLAAYLLESWVSSRWNEILSSNERGATEDGSRQDVKIRGIIYRFIHNSTRDLAGYFLESWVSSHWNEILSSNKRGVVKDFRHKVLHVTAWNGFSTAAEVLLTAGANVNWEDEGRMALHLAAGRGHEAVARLLVVEGKADVNAKDKDGWTPLHLAAGRGHEAVARLLVVEGKADVNATVRDGRTALHLAAGRGHEAVARLLVLELKADVNVRDEVGWTALHLAADEGHEAMVKLLVVDLKASVNVTDRDGRTALHLAAGRRHKAMVKLLVVELKADVNAKDGVGWTALHLAAGRGHEAVVRLLVVELKADINAKDGVGWTALHAAADEGHEAMVKLLVVDLKADVNATVRDGRTALHLAAGRGHEAVVRLLVMELKADVNAKDRFGKTALHLAAERRHEAAMKLLVIELKADVNAKDGVGWTALHRAADEGDEAVARLLAVELKADVNAKEGNNAKDGVGWTALHRAVDEADEAVMRLLVVELKADVNARDSFGGTALHLAAERRHEAVMKLLVIELKADVNAKDGVGWTALHRAADEGHEAVARLLVVELKADVNAKDRFGKTALHLAADRGHEAVMRLLVVDLKADVDAEDRFGKTPTHLAADWIKRQGWRF